MTRNILSPIGTIARVVGWVPLSCLAFLGCTAELGGLGEDGGAALGGGPTAAGGSGGSANAPGGAPSAGGGSDTGGVLISERGLPCEVQDLLVQHCEACHAAAIPARIVTHDDLVAPSQTDPARTVAEVALERMNMTTKGVMPPSPAPIVDLAAITAFEAWLEDGAPSGTCSTEAPPPDDPFSVEPTCTSNSNWTGGNRESPKMNPGQACIACHTREDEGPDLTIAGTLYPTAHEPDNCNGQMGSSTVFVEVTDAAGRVFKLTPNSAGNFLLEDPDAFTFPYTARVVAGGLERVMVELQEEGDCNSCHTQGGKEGAPGRIIPPSP